MRQELKEKIWKFLFLIDLFIWSDSKIVMMKWPGMLHSIELGRGKATGWSKLHTIISLVDYGGKQVIINYGSFIGYTLV